MYPITKKIEAEVLIKDHNWDSLHQLYVDVSRLELDTWARAQQFFSICVYLKGFIYSVLFKPHLLV